jgi:hypothetical protein
MSIQPLRPSGEQERKKQPDTMVENPIAAPAAFVVEGVVEV